MNANGILIIVVYSVLPLMIIWTAIEAEIKDKKAKRIEEFKKEKKNA